MEREEDPSTSWRRADQCYVAFTSRNFGPCGAKVEKELKMAGDKNKTAIWVLLLSDFTSVNNYLSAELSQ